MTLVWFQLPVSPAGTLLFNLQSATEIALCPPNHPGRVSVFTMCVQVPYEYREQYIQR